MNSTQLSRAEMKAIVGGKLDCQCACFDQPGAWSGSYSTEAGAYNAILTHCREGGACFCDVEQAS